jgi:hypothetical protein
MKHLLLGLLAVAGIFALSSLTARADDGYWVPAPSAPAASAPPSASYDYPPSAPAPYYPSAPYYAGPPPYYYGPPPGYYGPGYGYYGPRPGVHIFLPGIFFGFGFGGHHHR